jgi:hypothetical protein
MTAEHEIRFLYALLFSLLIETTVLYILLRKIWPKKFQKLSTPMIIFSGIITTLSTLPMIWFVLPLFTNTVTYAPVAETIAVLVEAIEYRVLLQTTMKRALWISLTCNMVSFLIGL